MEIKPHSFFVLTLSSHLVFFFISISHYSLLFNCKFIWKNYVSFSFIEFSFAMVKDTYLLTEQVVRRPKTYSINELSKNTLNLAKNRNKLKLYREALYTIKSYQKVVTKYQLIIYGWKNNLMLINFLFKHINLKVDRF